MIKDQFLQCASINNDLQLHLIRMFKTVAALTENYQFIAKPYSLMT